MFPSGSWATAVPQPMNWIHRGFCRAFFKKRPLALRALRHDFVGDVAGDGVVVVELHGEAGAAFGHAAEVADVAEHFL